MTGKMLEPEVRAPIITQQCPKCCKGREEMHGIIEFARWYERRGLSVIPFHPQEKKPLISWKEYQTKRAGPQQLHEWFPPGTDCNIGIVTGSISGSVVVDVDGPEGEAWLSKHVGRVVTPTVRTPNGFHLYFRHPGTAIPNSVKQIPGIDIRGDGGCVVAPPSIGASGIRYTWESNGAKGFADLPPAILEVANDNSSGAIYEGSRNAELTRQAGRLFKQGHSAADVLATLLKLNAQLCRPPLGEPEVCCIVESIGQREAGGTPPLLTRFSEIALEEVQWLWPGYLPRGKLVVLDGDPGLGKSILTIDIAARVSTGRQMPDGSQGVHGDVVMLAGEDGSGDTMRPRLDAAGADVTRIHHMRSGVAIPSGLPTIMAHLRLLDVKLIVIDPLVAVLDHSVNSWNDQQVRGALTPLAAAAEELGATVLFVRHLNKKPGNAAMYRGGGSIGIIGAARSAFVVAPDPKDPATRIFAATKANLSTLPVSYVFDLSTSANGAPVINWRGPSPLSADDLLCSDSVGSKQDRAVEFLQERLSGGPVPASDVYADGRAAGFSDRTLDRARKKRGILTEKNGLKGGWSLSLPE